MDYLYYFSREDSESKVWLGISMAQSVSKQSIKTIYTTPT